MQERKKFTALGLMSGTSADGVDFGVIETDGQTSIRLSYHGFKAYPEKLASKILSASQKTFHESVKGGLEQEITLFQANAAKEFISKNTLTDIDLVGFHGQTVFHIPPVYNTNNICLKKGKTCQLGNGILLSKELNLPVIYDFRSNDMASNGQGAPLVPVFHWAQAINHPNFKFPLAWLNIGGVANITFISKKDTSPQEIIAFDLGPGNALIDDWISYKTKQKEHFDKNGIYASKGKKHWPLIKKWMQHSYLNQPYPKSMDRSLFHFALEDCKKQNLSLEDGAATLTILTVWCIKKHLENLPFYPATLLVSGGGAKNTFLYHQLEKLVPHVEKTDTYHWSSDAIEAYAFGYLAVRSYLNLPISFPLTTKVSSPKSGGVLAKPPF